MIKFQLHLNDIEAFNKHYIKSNETFLQKYIQPILILFFIIIAVWNLQHKNATTSAYVSLFVFVIGAVAFIFAISKFTKKKMLANYVKKNPSVVGERIFANNDDILVITINGKDCDYPYKSFIKLVEDKEHYYAYVSAQSAVIIPKRLFQANEMPTILEKIKDGIAK